VNCYAHPNMAATAKCNSCGRGLCSPCSARFTQLRCQGCIISGNAAVVRQAYWAIALTVLVWAVGALIGGSMVYHSVTHPLASRKLPAVTATASPAVSRHAHQKNSSTPIAAAATTVPVPQPALPNPNPLRASIPPAIMLGFFFVLEFWGFRAISGKSRTLIVVANPVFWFVFFITRIFIACFVGAVAAPTKLFNAVRDIVIAKKTIRQLQQGTI